jgi:hypothetical protein
VHPFLDVHLKKHPYGARPVLVESQGFGKHAAMQAKEPGVSYTYLQYCSSPTS